MSVKRTVLWDLRTVRTNGTENGFLKNNFFVSKGKNWQPFVKIQSFNLSFGSCEKVFAGLSKLQSTCRVEFWGKHLEGKSNLINFQTLLQHWPKKPQCFTGKKSTRLSSFYSTCPESFFSEHNREKTNWKRCFFNFGRKSFGCWVKKNLLGCRKGKIFVLRKRLGEKSRKKQ